MPCPAGSSSGERTSRASCPLLGVSGHSQRLGSPMSGYGKKRTLVRTQKSRRPFDRRLFVQPERGLSGEADTSADLLATHRDADGAKAQRHHSPGRRLWDGRSRRYSVERHRYDTGSIGE